MKERPMTNNTLNILITGTGGPTPRSFARALKEVGTYKNYRLFGTDIHKYAVGLYQHHLFEKSFITPRSSQPAYWDAIQQIIDEYHIDMAVILPEAEVRTWSIRQAEGKLPCKALIPDIRAVNEMLDKSILTKALAPHGLVPKSVDIDPDDPALEQKINNSLTYPFWVRSATGSSGLGSFKVHSFADLMKWVSINEGVTNFIASDFLSGRNLACKFLYFDGKLLRSAVGERVDYIMAKISPSGITGNTSYGRLLNDPKVFELAHKAIEIMFEQTGADRHGFFTVDLKEDGNGKPFITEINVRHVAFTSAFAIGGANFCEDTIRLLDEDEAFDRQFKLYEFEKDLIFLREVDALPIVMKETELITDVLAPKKIH
jgi:hypothetical protein